jgi:acyl carrier protein
MLFILETAPRDIVKKCMNCLERELLELICKKCKLRNIELDNISYNAPLIGPESPLGTDSLDALEIAVTIQQKYGVRMDSENTTRAVLQSLATLAAYIRKNKSKSSHVDIL